MQGFVLLAIVGLAAQLVDGSLGMAYGVTSTTLLLAVGVSPALASAAVHLAEVGTCAVSGASHWRFGNVDWSKIAWMAVPGGVGAFLGAIAVTWLATVAEGVLAPAIAVFLFALGAYVLARFSFRRRQRPVRERPISRGFLGPLGFVAGFLDAVGGGGWGPISTPTLLSSGRMEPRKVVGTVDASEFAVALAASIGFLLALSFAEIPWQVVGALLLGGTVAAPIAAYVVRVLPARILGTAVGGVILVTNMRTFMGAVGIEGGLASVLYVAIVAVWVAALVHSVQVNRKEKNGRLAEGQTA
ncbi:MAG: sulfite exporter TauE/SafE family protein [Actinomycetota bacterium]|nr:sulfite exporter TauE/SafE family protein [Actinomycetota bacterium]